MQVSAANFFKEDKNALIVDTFEPVAAYKLGPLWTRLCPELGGPGVSKRPSCSRRPLSRLEEAWKTVSQQATVKNHTPKDRADASMKAIGRKATSRPNHRRGRYLEMVPLHGGEKKSERRSA